MGATLSVVCRSSKIAHAVCSHLTKTTPEPLKNVHWKWDPYWWVEGLNVGTKFSDFHGIPHELVFCILRWTALNYGRKQRGFQIDEVKHPFPVPVPYVRYDGFENWPVLGPDYKRKVGEHLEWCQVDELGLPRFPGCAQDLVRGHPGGFDLYLKSRPHEPGHRQRLERVAKNVLKEGMTKLRIAMTAIVEGAP